MVKHSLRRGSWQGRKKNLVSMKQKNEQSDKGKTGEPVDFVFDVPIHPW